MNEYKVQRAGLVGQFKTICSHKDRAYAEGVYTKQLEVTCVGRFRLLDPDGKVLLESTAKPLFSNN